MTSEKSVTYLIHVHVALGAAAGLENDEREVFDKLSGDDLNDEFQHSRSNETTSTH